MIETLKKIWSWLRWVLLGILGFLAVIFVRKSGIALLGELGLVAKPRSFTRIPGRDDAVMVSNDQGELQEVLLPAGVKANQVSAVEVDPAKGAKVEVRHETTDRKNPGPAISDSARDRIRRALQDDDAGGGGQVADDDNV